MKKYIYLLLVVFCFGCSDFLDTKNLTQKDSSNFPVTEEDMRNVIAGVYAMNTYAEVGADRWKNLFLISECMADYTVSGGSIGDLHVRALFEYKQSSVNFLSAMWRRLYGGIYRANFVLETVDNVEWSSEEEKNKLLGEAYFLRANFYFDLARAFENIPLATSTTVANDTPQSKPEEIYQLILSDLKKAIEYLPATSFQNMSQNELGHATRWAAEGMMARVYLFYSGVYGKESIELLDGTN